MTEGIIARILPWILPPVLGAAIGFITNALAIRMLFRPLTEKRFLGIRIPLTPGIIPKQRRALAENIGKMVSQQLITEDALRIQIETAGFRKGIETNISVISSRILETPLNTVKTGQLDFLYRSLDGFLAETLKGFLNSRSFLSAVRGLLSQTVQTLSRKQLNTVLADFDIKDFLEKRILPLLKDGRARNWMKSTTTKWMDKQIRQNTQLDRFITDPLVEAAAGLFRSVLPALLDALFEWLNRNEMKNELESRGRILVKDVLERLNSFQKFFVTVAQYDRTIDDKMPEIINEALQKAREMSESEENREQIVQAVKNAIESWREKDISNFKASSKIKIEQRVADLVDNAADYLEGEAFEKRLTSTIEGFIESNGEFTLGEIVSRTLGLHEPEIVDMAASPLLRYLTREDTSDAISKQIIGLLEGFLEDNGDMSVGDLVRMTEEKKGKLDAFLTEKLIGVLTERLPRLVETFDVQGLVIDKINGLDVLQVEKLLLIVIAKHLKWINVFGAFLGAFIGFSQVIINIFQ